MLTCRDVADELMRYLDGELDPIRRRAFRAHLIGCRACASYLTTYRSAAALARRIYREGRQPGPLSERLVRSITGAARFSARELWNLLAAVAASPLLFFYFGPK